MNLDQLFKERLVPLNIRRLIYLCLVCNDSDFLHDWHKWRVTFCEWHLFCHQKESQDAHIPAMFTPMIEWSLRIAHRASGKSDESFRDYSEPKCSAWVSVLALSLTICQAWAENLLPGAWSPLPQKSRMIVFIWWSCVMIELKHTKHLEECLACNKQSVHVSYYTILFYSLCFHNFIGH